MNKILVGDCLVKLKELEDNSVDSIVTDPPYHLVSIVKRFGGENSRNTPAMNTKEGGVFARKAKGFMGKEWDGVDENGMGIAMNVDMWAECLRVLKPGGHLLAFSGTRTYHRMAVAIEDAGFEVRDMIEWIYSTGFPKSLNIGKSVNQLETNEWSRIGKALDNIDQKSIIEIWNTNSNNVKIVGTQSLKNQIIAGQDTPSENFVVLNVAQNNNQESSNLLVSFVEQNLSEVPAINTKTNTALLSVEAEIRQLQNNAKSAEQQSQNQNHKSWNIFTAQCDVREWLNENMEVSHKVDEVLKTLRGNKKYSNEEITNVLCVVIPNILKLTILNQSKTFQSLDTTQKMECVSAINVIITEYIMENLISNTVDILKSKAVDKLQGNEREVVGEKVRGDVQKAKESGSTFAVADANKNNKAIFGYGVETLTKGTSEWEGWGTALKPAHEPICMARKPLGYFKKVTLNKTDQRIYSEMYDRYIAGTLTNEEEKQFLDLDKKMTVFVPLSVAENCLKWGTGGINIDESRVGTEERYNAPAKSGFSATPEEYIIRPKMPKGCGKYLQQKRTDKGISRRELGKNFASWESGREDVLVQMWEKELNIPTKEQWDNLVKLLELDDRFSKEMFKEETVKNEYSGNIATGRFPANLILSWSSDEYMLKLDVSVDDLIKLKKHYERPQDLQENMGENER